MTYDETKAAIAKRTAIPATSVDTILDALRDMLHEGGEVSLPGVGKFGTKQRAARDGRNPKTGEAIKIPAKVVPTFKAAKAYKDAVNGGVTP